MSRESMTLTRAVLVLALAAVVCAAGGLAIGYALGRYAPSYYYSVFRPEPGMPFDPVAVGVGLGLTQGLVVGLIVGSVLVSAVALYRRRTDPPVEPAPPFARRAP